MNFLGIRLTSKILDRYKLPDILYPMSLKALDTSLSENGEWPFGAMLHQLQTLSQSGDSDWLCLEPAMDRLAQILAPDDSRAVLVACAKEWWLEIGSVDLNGPIITIQRGDKLVAALQATDGGKLRVATYRPLDAKSAKYLTNLGLRPYQEYGVCMRENNWEYALDCSAGNGNWYAADRGESYLSCWRTGLGHVSGGDRDIHWWKLKDIPSRLPALVIAELGINYSYTEA